MHIYRSNLQCGIITKITTTKQNTKQTRTTLIFIIHTHTYIRTHIHTRIFIHTYWSIMTRTHKQIIKKSDRHSFIYTNIQDIYNTQLVQKDNNYIHTCTKYKQFIAYVENIFRFHKTAWTDILYMLLWNDFHCLYCGFVGVYYSIYLNYSMKMYPS